MPTYEFRCPDGHEFEKFYRKMSDAVFELPCPECGKPLAYRWGALRSPCGWKLRVP